MHLHLLNVFYVIFIKALHRLKKRKKERKTKKKKSDMFCKKIKEKFWKECLTIHTIIGWLIFWFRWCFSTAPKTNPNSIKYRGNIEITLCFHMVQKLIKYFISSRTPKFYFQDFNNGKQIILPKNIFYWKLFSIK